MHSSVGEENHLLPVWIPACCSHYCHGFVQLPAIMFNNYLCFLLRICFVKHQMQICQNEEITLSSLTWFPWLECSSNHRRSCTFLQSHSGGNILKSNQDACLPLISSWLIFVCCWNNYSHLTVGALLPPLRRAASGVCNVSLHQLCQICQFLI